MPPSPATPVKLDSQQALAECEAFLAARRWRSFAFQRALWAAVLAGESGLLHAPTGTGKTYAAFLGALLRARATHSGDRGLRILWLTPLRALAADTTLSLQSACNALAPTWRVALRTGDVSTAERAKQDRTPPEVMVTTPESLTLMLSKADWHLRLAHVETVIVDEWHELFGQKRGVLVELALARLRSMHTAMITWGLSATLGNTREAMQCLLGVRAGPGVAGTMIEGETTKQIVIDALMPETIERFPWAGHLGLKLLPEVIAAIDAAKTTLVFTNTRSQTEIWYQALLNAKPEWAGQIALHHGSLEKSVRDWVEAGLRDGSLRAVVCTASLDLGVDFQPVERVLQIGSPKGVARLLQRAGRSGHAPGAVSRATVVPTHALELVEAAAARVAGEARQLEQRATLNAPLDVLTQHLVTCAIGGGFAPAELRTEVESTWTYKALSDADWDWALGFVTHGGVSLQAYPEYRKVVLNEEGLYTVPDKRTAQRHRMAIGTIVADASMTVQFQGGARLGYVEESFIARLKAGDAFVFAGRTLEFIRAKEMTAWVRIARKKTNVVPRWGGGNMPLSTQLAVSVRQLIAQARGGVFTGPEMQAVAPLLRVQARWSALPAEKEWLVETLQSRDAHHLFIYPFEGRLVHLGLATLWSYRLARAFGRTFSIAINDYGFELSSATPIVLTPTVWDELLALQNVAPDILAGVNAAELGRRQFREIARVAGLVFQGYPGQSKTARQLQASSGLLYDVFAQYDASNPLLTQAEREVLERQLEASRLLAALARLRAHRRVEIACERPTPFSFPLMVEGLREQLSTEKLEARVVRMVAELEEKAGA
jgi:ATP-dependent helicase Lhr and Lhr-like helicase